MSYDIHLLRFKRGEPDAQPAGAVYELLARATKGSPDEHGYARAEWNGGEADLYGVPTSAVEPVESLMFSRPAGADAIFDLLVEVASAGRMAILLQDGEVCLPDPDLAAELPDDISSWRRHIVASGADLALVISKL